MNSHTACYTSDIKLHTELFVSLINLYADVC